MESSIRRPTEENGSADSQMLDSSAKAARRHLLDVSFVTEFNKSSLMARIVGMSHEFGDRK